MLSECLDKELIDIQKYKRWIKDELERYGRADAINFGAHNPDWDEDVEMYNYLLELLKARESVIKGSLHLYDDYKYLQLNADLNAVPESCKHCPNHPSNGGSGICHCILGLPQVTC